MTFCYFPITFRPPPEDPYGITTDDLKKALRECLSATSYFAKFALPLIMEKLSSSSGNAKKDSMDTIAACAPVYGAAALAPHVNELFDALKIEVGLTPKFLEPGSLTQTPVICTLDLSRDRRQFRGKVFCCHPQHRCHHLNRRQHRRH